VIYAFEYSTAVRTSVIERVVQACLAPGGMVVTSRLTRLECRVKPLRNRDAVLLAHYDSFFSLAKLGLVEVSADVLEAATQLRADHAFKSPDAIHLASALYVGASHFLTGVLALHAAQDYKSKWSARSVSCPSTGLTASLAPAPLSPLS
jgi:predicted nucleic acid-binding protein